MERVAYLIVMGFVWALVGVLTNAHKGALVAAIVGFLMMIGLTVSFIASYEEGQPANPLARVIARIVFWLSLALALLFWGNETFSNSGTLKFLAWVAGGVVLFRLLAFARYKAEQKWATD